jgi:hypothetical protein
VPGWSGRERPGARWRKSVVLSIERCADRWARKTVCADFFCKMKTLLGSASRSAAGAPSRWAGGVPPCNGPPGRCSDLRVTTERCVRADCDRHSQIVSDGRIGSRDRQQVAVGATCVVLDAERGPRGWRSSRRLRLQARPAQPGLIAPLAWSWQRAGSGSSEPARDAILNNKSSCGFSAALLATWGSAVVHGSGAGQGVAGADALPLKNATAHTFRQGTT